MLSEIPFLRRGNKRYIKNKDEKFSLTHLIKREEKCEKLVSQKI